MYIYIIKTNRNYKNMFSFLKDIKSLSCTHSHSLSPLLYSPHVFVCILKYSIFIKIKNKSQNLLNHKPKK